MQQPQIANGRASLSSGRPSLPDAASQNDPNNESKKSEQLEHMLRQTTKDNEQLKQQLQQMIDINSQQQLQLAVQQAQTGPKMNAPFTPGQAYQTQAIPSDNQVTNLIEQRPLSKDRTAQRRPIATPSSQTGQDQSNLKQETHNVPMNLADRTIQVMEQEDDRGQIQQVSGGFGDSNNMDEAALAIAFTGEQRALQLALKYQPLDEEAWASQAQSLDYIMESQVFDYELLRQAPDFGMKQYNEAVYRGELANGKRNGLGVMQYRKARVYEGQWQGDARSGRGMERYSNGNRYEGEFLNGKPHGKGVYTWANGEVYEGEWALGLKEGQGIWKGIFGDSYIGEWRQSKATGYGVHQWKNGDRYEGEWQNCLKHGQGSDIFANGDCFTGTYVQGKPEGQGQYKWKNGSIYIGEFKDGLKHGKGKWKKRFNDQNCNMYEGQYQNDKKNGMGVFTWESGNYYKGCYKDDERHGYGEMFWKDGSCYKGEWIKGIQNGVGRMEFPDGRVKEGLFENNTFKGPQMATPQLRNLKAQEIILNQTLQTPPTDQPNRQNRIRITKSRAGSHPRQLLADSGKIQIPNKVQTKAMSPSPELNTSEKKKSDLQYPPPLPDKPVQQQVEQAQMGQGSQAQSFENVDVNPFIVKPQHKTAVKVQLKRPGVLNPVQDPRQRDHSIGGSSDGGEGRSLQGSAIGGPQQSHGYVSGGLQTDTESARLSNVQPYKFNTNPGQKNAVNPNVMNIRKINPNTVQLKPVSRGSGVGVGLRAQAQISQTIPAVGGERSVLSPEYVSGNQSIMSGGSLGLPSLKVTKGATTRGGVLSSAGSGSQTLDSNQKLRKASPEALALMMANKKKNEASASGSAHWVPGGKSMQRENSRQRKLFY